MLLEWIEQAKRLSEIEAVSPEEALKWINQIQDAIQYLHRRDLIWGDAKATNILINKDGDAILVDFGGGFTDGWVDQKRCGTVEGDLQGFQRITSFVKEKIL